MHSRFVTQIHIHSDLCQRMGIRELRANVGMKWTSVCIVFACLLIQPSSALIMRTGYAGFLHRVDPSQLAVMIDYLARYISDTLIDDFPYFPGIIFFLDFAFPEFRVFVHLNFWNGNTCNLGRGGEAKQPITSISGAEMRTIAMDFVVPAVQSLMRHHMGYGFAIHEGISILYYPVQPGPGNSFRVMDNSLPSHQHGQDLMNDFRRVWNRNMISDRRGSLANSSSTSTKLSPVPQTDAPSVASLGQNGPPVTRKAHGDNSTNSSSTDGTTFARRKFPVDPNGDCDVLDLALVWAVGPDYDDESVHAPQILNPTDKIWSPNARFYLVMQLDCNLVLYDGKSGVALWSSQTQNHGSTCFATLTSTGELIVYDTIIENLLFRTNTWCSANGGDCYTFTVLEVQDDGNMVLYIFQTGDVLFSSDTIQCDGGCES